MAVIGELSMELDTSKGGSNPKATLLSGEKSKTDALAEAGVGKSIELAERARTDLHPRAGMQTKAGIRVGMSYCCSPITIARKKPTHSKRLLSDAENVRQTVRMDSPADIEEGKWVALAELAALRGINKLSAARLVRRHGWRRQPDNEGRVRVLVPFEALEAKADSPRDSQPDSPAAIAALQGAIASLSERAAAAEKRADQAEIRAERAETRADRAEQSADMLRERLEATQAELRHAQQAADALRQANEAWQAKGRLSKLLAALRGR